MKIQMQEDEAPSRLARIGWDIAIVGKPVDDRGRAAIAFLREHAPAVVTVDYEADDFQLEVDGLRRDAEDIDEYLDKFRQKLIILETTTLGFVEIFLCCRSMQRLGFRGLSLLYVEPQRYSNPRRSQLIHKRDFELSEKVPGYKPVPGATFMLSDRSPQRGVFFVGYEEQRLDRAFEDFQMIRPSQCSVVFGVPAFKPGWEMDAFANNIRVIRERNIRGGVHFCGAESPVSAIEVLTEIFQGLGQSERLFVAPIGTKPMGIGVALFVAEHLNIGLLYDHPRRRVGRSTKTGKWHLFNIEFDPDSSRGPTTYNMPYRSQSTR